MTLESANVLVKSYSVRPSVDGLDSLAKSSVSVFITLDVATH